MVFPPGLLALTDALSWKKSTSDRINSPKRARGGLIGQDSVEAGTANSYWDLETSGINDPSKGAGNVPNDPGITGLTDVQLKSGPPSGFSPAIWKESAKLNSGYPYLIDNPPQ
jgi:hypothetical protein